MAVTTLPGNMGVLDWTDWVRGLLTAFIGGGSGAVSAGFGTMVVDPKDFNVYSGKIYEVMGATFLFSAVIQLFQYLHTKPIPALVQTERTTQTTQFIPSDPQATPPPAKVITTEKVTSVAPAGEPPKGE